MKKKILFIPLLLICLLALTICMVGIAAPVPDKPDMAPVSAIAPLAEEGVALASDLLIVEYQPAPTPAPDFALLAVFGLISSTALSTISVRHRRNIIRRSNASVNDITVGPGFGGPLKFPFPCQFNRVIP